MELSDSISTLPFVGPNYEKKLERLNINTIFDLLHHVPHRYLDFSKVTKISDIKIGETVTVIGQITSIRNQTTKSGRLMQIGQIDDESGKITIAWFSQPFLTRMLYPNLKIAVSGETSWFAGKPCFFSPQYEKIDEDHETVHTGKIVGIYPATAGITSKWIKARINYAISRVEIKEFLKDKKSLIDFKKAIHDIHFPNTLEDAEKAKERLAFNEFYNLLIKAKERKKKLIKKQGVSLEFSDLLIKKFINSFPFKLTESQNKVTKEILTDLRKGSPMNRLLQGDVGSGKTIVATISIYATHLSGYKTVFLAPTQILAQQHFEAINNTLTKIDKTIKTQLITSGLKKNDDVHVYIGTHAILNQMFEKVGLLIVDEQHKFGVKQINFLQKLNPHLLTMTATPIPRTIAQTLFSDMDLSVIDELPKNRQKIKTWLVPNSKRLNAYEWCKQQIVNNKSQMFVICPLVEESESETLKDVKTVKKEFENLKSIFKDQRLGLLYGKMKDNDKNKLLSEFSKGNIDILVSTPVVEVGIDIPNATIMIIEAADRFGLAALHQLRGRVGRGHKESYCLLFTENESDKTSKRLTALTETTSGFELAELDLKLRGAGEILGTKQSGFGNLKIADWSQTKLIKLASEVVNNV